MPQNCSIFRFCFVPLLTFPFGTSSKEHQKLGVVFPHWACSGKIGREKNFSFLVLRRRICVAYFQHDNLTAAVLYLVQKSNPRFTCSHRLRKLQKGGTSSLCSALKTPPSGGEHAPVGRWCEPTEPAGETWGTASSCTAE